MNIKYHRKRWQPLPARQARTVSLENLRELQTGWHYLELRAKNSAALNMIAVSSPLFLQQNHNLQSVEIRRVSHNRLALVFFRHNPLTHIHIQWPEQAEAYQEASFALKIATIPVHRAWLHMMHQISRYHRQQGQNWQYIYRITRARIKRAGYAEALRKLVREYQPLLSHQLISCEPYQYWQTHFESVDASTQSGPHPVVFVVRSGDEQRLSRSLQSICQQTQSHWLALVDADNLPADFRDDSRIQVVDPQNLPLDTNTWYWLIESGDELKANALEHINHASSEYPAAQIIYTDHDCIDHQGQRSHPYFKPDWNPDYFYTLDYIGNACLLKGGLLNHLLLEQNQRWWRQPPADLRTICLSLLPAQERHERIIHLPQVLYHQWIGNPVETHSEHVIQDLLEYDQENVQQITRHGPVKEIIHLIPTPSPMVTLLVPTRDALEITRTCIDSVLEKTTYDNFEIIILDNQSAKPATLDWFKRIRQHPKVRVLSYNHPFNYSAINNFGVQHAQGEIIGLLNNDTEVINPDWLSQMVRHAIRPCIGCVGAKLYYFDDTVQHAGVIVGLYGIAGHAHKNVRRLDPGYMHRLQTVQNFSAVTAACLLVRKTVYEEVGGLNETNLTVAFNDVDFCLKVQAAGYRNLWTPYAELYHYESKSRGSDNTPQKIARARKEGDYMRRVWGHIIAHDPAYNPNLTRMREDFGVRLESGNSNI